MQKSILEIHSHYHKNFNERRDKVIQILVNTEKGVSANWKKNQ